MSAALRIVGDQQLRFRCDKSNSHRCSDHRVTVTANTTEAKKGPRIESEILFSFVRLWNFTRPINWFVAIDFKIKNLATEENNQNFEYVLDRKQFHACPFLTMIYTQK